MNFLKILAIFFFEWIDTHIHKKRILNFLRKEHIKINNIFDVGSHKGTYTDLFIKNFKIRNAYIFEPQKKIYKFLKEKYKNNKKIHIMGKAVSNFSGVKKLFINRHDLTSSLTALDDNNMYLKFKSFLFGGKSLVVQTYNVNTIKLKSFILQKKIKKIDLLKIDTEGHELQVLKGLEEKIKIVQIILVEFHNDKIYQNYSSEKVHKYLNKKNFKLKTKIKFPFTQWEDRIYISNQFV